MLCRVHWVEPTLFNFACSRMRVAFSLEAIEANMKVWNRLAKHGLENEGGFRQCLKHTLYRPRDLLALLNNAFLIAARDSRREIIADDVTGAARKLSADRLSDLTKEYDTVFPGIATFSGAFHGLCAELDRNVARQAIEDSAAELEDDRAAYQHFATVRADGILQGLYGVGFLGIQDKATNQFQFCHDGRRAEDSILDAQRLLIHPCYHIALNCRSSDNGDGNRYEIFDEHDITVVSDQIELRRKEIGRLVAKEGTILKGAEGFEAFESWCKRALEIICAARLTNFERHPNSDGVNRRDIVGTCLATTGFWHRMLESYDTRQVVFEIKNYDDITQDDCRQLQDYLHDHYGRAGFILTRSANENLGSPQLEWVRAAHANHGKLLVILPLKILRRLLSKSREPSKHDEVESQLNKLVDRYERNYLEAPAGRRKKR